MHLSRRQLILRYSLEILVRRTLIIMGPACLLARVIVVTDAILKLFPYYYSTLDNRKIIDDEALS